MILNNLVLWFHKGLFILSFAFFCSNTFGQPLSGTFTVGNGGQYATVANAVADVTSKGVSGPVIFRLKTGTFEEQVTIGPVTGSSSTNTITFEAESGNAPDVVLSFAPSSSDNYVILLDNASFITLRNLTIQTSGSSYTRAIYGRNNLNTITFEGLKIILPATTSASEDRGAIVARVPVSSNLRFINNTITGGSVGVLYVGNSSARSPGTVFTGNTITNVYYRPAFFEYLQGLVFNDNTITYTGTAYSDYYGAAIQNTSGYLEMLRNRITGTAGHALRLAYCSGLQTQPSVIANNFFRSASSYSTVYIYYSLNYMNFYHNSVNNTSTGEAFYFNRGQSTGNRIVNNIFKSNTGYVVQYQTSSTANSILESDYNNLFTSGSFIGRDGSTNYGTLASWQTGIGFETNSVTYDPQFQSNTDLSSSAPGIASTGQNLLSAVPADINGLPRTATPSLGATQFSAAALVPLSGTYTIGTGAFDFASINAAIESMKVNGISGPVTFRLNAEIFAERFVLPAISGMSSANPITFESQSGDPADVILTPPAATGAASNYIARLSNAAYVTFRNITFRPATGTSFNRAILVENRGDNLTFENLRINLPATTSTSEDRGAMIVRPSLSSNLRFINNTITGGSVGVLYAGNNSARSPGTVFTGNTITNVYYRPAFFEYLQGLVFNDNTVTYTGTAYSDYYGAAIQNTSGYLEILRNRITGTVGHALRLAYCSGLPAQPSIIANNFLHSNSSYTTLYVFTSLNHANIYHNSAHNTSTGEAFYFNRGQSTGNRIVNNIFKATTGYAVEYQNSSTANSILESDYNNLFTSGSFIGRNGSTNYGTLASWQTASGFESNSVSIDPQFQSNVALYTSSSTLSAAGANVTAAVPDDIDGIARPSTPSLGATQFGTSGTPLNGEYTINASGSGPANFNTFTEALDALKNFGINGPVVFKVSGAFNEQLTFLSVSGSSTTNTVAFESASGQPGDAVIHFSSNSGAANFTIRLSNADHHRFRNLTIRAENANYARVVQAINRAINIRFEGNVIESVVTTTTSSERAGILIASTQAQDVQLLNNTVRNGSYGIQFTGPSIKGTGTVIQGNIVDKAYHRGIDLTNQTGFIVDKNQVLNNPSATSFTGIQISNVDGAFQITANKVTGGNGTALSLTSALAPAGSPALIANNFLQTNNGSGYQTVYLNHLRNVNIYHNNINATGTGNGFYYVSSSGQNVNINNNIIKAAGLAVNIVNPVAIGQIDHNNYYTPGATLGNWGASSASDLAAWQAFTGQEGSSLSVDPQYQSTSDLSALASSLAGAGLDLTAIVPTDINGGIRTIPVSIGASQFIAAFAIDGTVSKLLGPVSSCALTEVEHVIIEVTNLGASAISGFKVAYRLGSEAPVIEDIPTAVSVAPGGKYQHTFTGKASLSAKQTYHLETYLILAGDENPANDNLVATIAHYPDLVTSISDNLGICKGESVTLTATGGVTYVWSTGANGAGITVSPTGTTTYSVQITNANDCQETRQVTVTVRETPVISYTGDVGFTASYVSPLQGASDVLFEYRIIYTDANGNLPGPGYPRIELDANGNGQATDPLDIVRVMQEADAADTDVADGKEYRVSITDLANNISWRSRIVTLNSGGCRTQTAFVSGPSVSNDLLDVGIYANDISFSKANPAINESIKIYARVRNTSDYLAENFVVSAYIGDEKVFSQVIRQLNPQASITVQWDQSFPAPGFYPVKVVVDETDVLHEDNELNNFAIRPILTGDYELPGGITFDANPSALALQPGQVVTVTGRAQYFGIDPSVNPDVAGATVIGRVVGGSVVQSTTRPDGGYTLTVVAPRTPGTYSLNIEVTDYTLTGYGQPISFVVLPAPPAPDLSAFISLDRNTIITGEQVAGMVILQNNGEIEATNFLFRFFNCDAVLGEEQIASLAPGESRTFTFTTTTGVIGDCFNRNNCLFRAVADVNNTVAEKSESNNQSSAYLTVLPDKPDLTPLNSTNNVIPGYVNMLKPFTFSVRVDNIGGVNANTPFAVSIYMDDQLIRTENIPLLNSCEGNVFSITYDFGGSTADKILTIKVDEPIGSGAVDEYRETNNEFSKIIRHVPPPPQYSNLNVASRDISVAPQLPPAGSTVDIDVVYRNNGQLPITAPFKVEMTVTEGGIPRIETQTINETILPGATQAVTLNTSLATDGDHSVRIRLDADNTISESSEGDNIAQMPLCVDLSVSPVGNVWGSFYVGTLQHLTARVYNHGLFTPSDVSVSFYLDNVKIASAILPMVQPTTKVPYYSVSIPHIFGLAGTFELKVVVDDPAAYTECREDNNEYKGTIAVRTPAADVRVFSEYISPSKINPDVNEPITIFLSYDNTGLGDSGPFKARILIDDVPLGADVSIPSVAAGDDGTIEIPAPYSSATAGVRVIRAVLDPDNQLPETSKLNNHATRGLVVGKAPNLLFTDLTSDIVCPDDGSNVTITATIRNDGDIESTAEVLFYYIADADTIPVDSKPFILAGKASASIQTEWMVINKTYSMFAEIRNSAPLEYDESDNFIHTKFCSGPYYNLFVQAEGQGLIHKTPDLTRFEGAQTVTLSATPATGWVFAGWQGDGSGAANPLTVTLSNDQTVVAVFNETLVAPEVTGITRCGAGPVTLEASGAVGAQTYAWYTVPTGGTPIPYEQGAMFTTPALSSTTSYYVALSSFDNEGPRIEVKATILDAPSQPEIAVEGSQNCMDENSPTILRAPAGSPGYLWSTGEMTLQIEVALPGNYWVQLIDDNGCLSVASEVKTFFSRPMQPAILAEGSQRCVGENNPTMLLAPAGSSGYLWSTGETTQQIEVATPGTYSLQVVDDNGCVSVPSEVQNIFSVPMQPGISVVGPQYCVDESNPTILQAPSGFSDYLWSSGETTPQIVVTTMGVYALQVIDENGCVSVASEAKAIFEAPVKPDITVEGSQTCMDENSPTLLRAPSGFSGYLWSNGETTEEIAVSAGGAYAVQVVDEHGCVSVASEVKDILPQPLQPEITVDGPLNCPDENNPTILEAPGGFAGYLWSTGETTSQIEVTSAGTYRVQGVDDNGCLSIPSPEVLLTQEACGEVIVYNAISPENGDDLNNHLIIKNIDKLPETRENTLKIYNRWGDVVFETRNYDNVNNTFVGRANDGTKLSSGTYFYILEFNSKRRKMSGYIVVR